MYLIIINIISLLIRLTTCRVESLLGWQEHRLRIGRLDSDGYGYTRGYGSGRNFEYGSGTGTGNGLVLRIRVGYQKCCTRRPLVLICVCLYAYGCAHVCLYVCFMCAYGCVFVRLCVCM